MKICVIDIGTNSMRLLVSDFKDNKFMTRKKYVNTTRIGKGVDEFGYLTKDAIDNNVNALIEFKKICDENKCEQVYCIGTSALRDSKNKEEFIKNAKEKTNIDVSVISGEEESYLGFKGVLSGVETSENILVIDIGGGSTEFIVGNSKEILFSKSEDIGALRLTEKFFDDKFSNEESILNMENFINNTIKETINIIKNYEIGKVVGIGGTITSVSAINQELEVYSMEKIHNSEIYSNNIENIFDNLKNMTLDDKKKVKGLQEKRADIIVSGVGILNIIMKNIEKDTIVVSEYDNLEGLVCEKVRNMS